MPPARRWPINLPLVIVVLCWGFNFVALKVLYREMTAPTVAVVRAGVMYFSLVSICWFRKESLRPLPGDRLGIALSGLLTLGIYMVLFLEGTRQTVPGEAATLLATTPLFAVLWSALFGIERLRASVIWGTLVSFVGVATVMFGGGVSHHGTLIGNLLVLASSVVWALAAVQAKPLLARYSPVQLLAVSMPYALPLIGLYGGNSVVHTRFDRISTVGWLMFAQVAFLSGVVAFVGFYTGIQQVGSAVATRYQFFVPAVAVLFAALILGQVLQPIQFVGMGVVILGVYLGSKKPESSLDTHPESVLFAHPAE